MQRYIALGVLGLFACARGEPGTEGGNGRTDANNSMTQSDAPDEEEMTDARLVDAPPQQGGVCGNGTMTSGEACDDNNTANNDGCSSTCALEPTQTVTLTALARTITDNAYNGTLTSMACVDVAVPAWHTPAIASMTVTFGVNHSWVGDLTMKVVHPDNTTVTVMSRPGLVEPTDDGTASGLGATGRLMSTYPVTFSQSAVNSAESMGVGGGTVCLNNAANCNWVPANGSAAAGTLANFNAKTSTGTWKVCVGDSNAQDTGSIDHVTLTIQH